MLRQFQFFVLMLLCLIFSVTLVEIFLFFCYYVFKIPYMFLCYYVFKIPYMFFCYYVFKIP